MYNKMMGCNGFIHVLLLLFATVVDPMDIAHYSWNLTTTLINNEGEMYARIRHESRDIPLQASRTWDKSHQRKFDKCHKCYCRQHPKTSMRPC
ncbi:hypothetical protein K492DRAFT_170683 [Lichtheimia hyalospora FSU 10163]|nr:hypothetical protein K492DRAFT_170683 [Lichtheimia hyalospora FSU 10163]